MQAISESDIVRRIRFENPWWGESLKTQQRFRNLEPRAYLKVFLPLVTDSSVQRAVVLLGPRRVGKTVMIYHSIQALLDAGVNPRRICYISVDSPIYNTLSLERLVHFFEVASGTSLEADGTFIFFDEIQYLKSWEVHLKSLVDTFPNLKAIASGSAAAALKLKSHESGAGRFTDFLLPPLTFYEYLLLLKQDKLVMPSGGERFPTSTNLAELNQHFVHYLNFGGYPEVIFSAEIQGDPARFIKSDIIDKVLLRDLPSLYGINDIQELNALFTTLAFNTADEVSLEKLSRNSGVAKNTIKRYIDYLEAAFLLKIVHRIDRNAKRFQRAATFKVYLTNPSIRAALFEPVQETDEAVPYLTETAIFSQWFHSETLLHYARWADGEVDMVMLDVPNRKVSWTVEVKWTDRYCDHPEELTSLISFCKENGLRKATVTSKTRSSIARIDGIELEFVPAALYCYVVGYNLIGNRGRTRTFQKISQQPRLPDSESPEMTK